MKEFNNPIILFDGVCNLCNASVQFIIKHDKKGVFRFASLQSEFGKSIVNKFNLADKNIDSVMLFENNTVQLKSEAALRIAKRMGGIYSILFAFIIIPRFIRDSIYDYIARNRYRWFGKQESCMIPTPELKKLFIEV
ncbi:MAG: thiol-disulfide oxidoreductase DCC family protein [Bacteroidia bacterium]